MIRYLRLIAIFISNTFSVQLEYRANFLINLLASMLDIGANLFAISLFFTSNESFGGWSYAEAAVVLGVFVTVEGFISSCLYPNLNRISEHIRMGTLDFLLLKPIDSQFVISTRNIYILRFADMLLGLIVIYWALQQLPAVTTINLLLAALLLISGLVMVYSLWFLLATMSFWFVKVENITELFNTFFSAGRLPITAFPTWIRRILTYVVPIAFITTVPAQALTGQLNPWNVLVSIVLALALFICSRTFWYFALRNYTSASS
ncbi:MAG: ABC-2 family transporter protein [Acidobacteriota bacterium]